MYEALCVLMYKKKTTFIINNGMQNIHTNALLLFHKPIIKCYLYYVAGASTPFIWSSRKVITGEYLDSHITKLKNIKNCDPDLQDILEKKFT